MCKLFPEGWFVGVLRVASGIKVGLCAGCVQAVPLLVFRQSGRGSGVEGGVTKYVRNCDCYLAT